jgi:exosortase
VTLFAAYAAWDRRAALPAVAWRARSAGVLALALSLVTLAVGYSEESLTVRALSLALAGLALVVLAWGVDAARTLAFPAGFFVLAVPLPPSVLDRLSALAQSLAAAVAGQVLDLLDIPVVRDGQTFSLRHLDVVITEDCDGLPFLFAAIVVGIAGAWAIRMPPRQRLTIVVLAVAAGIGANLVRVAGTVVLASIEPAAVVGTPHQVFGKTVYLVVGVSAAAVAVRLVRRAHGVATTASR